MRKLTVLTVALAALMTAALYGAPAFADDAQPAAEAPADSSATTSTDAPAPDAAPASEEKPAE